MKRFALFVLSVLVSLPLLAAKVTSVAVSVNPPAFEGQCPKMFEFTGTITADSAGVVSYKWTRSDGATAPEQTIEFKQKGRQVVKTTWTLGDAATLPSFDGWQAVEILSPNKTVSNRAKFSLKCVQSATTAPNAPVTTPVLAPRTKTPIRPVPPCLDPAAFEIRFEIVRRDTPFRGRVRITGVVKNIGTAPFTCNPGSMQASAHLYELPPGAVSGGTLRGHTDFSSLAVNGTVTVSYERDWDSSSPAEGEFPTSFRLMIVYDPDILLDGNKANDDCKINNNTKSRSGTEINALLR